MTYTTVGPRSREVAEALLVAADRLGLDASTVRTSARGYIVPDAVAAEYERMKADPQPVEDEPYNTGIVPEYAGGDPAPAPEKSSFPDASWKNEAIKTYAEDNGIDLGGATKKADMLAAIQSADTKEE